MRCDDTHGADEKTPAIAFLLARAHLLEKDPPLTVGRRAHRHGVQKSRDIIQALGLFGREIRLVDVVGAVVHEQHGVFVIGSMSVWKPRPSSNREEIDFRQREEQARGEGGKIDSKESSQNTLTRRSVCVHVGEVEVCAFHWGF